MVIGRVSGTGWSTGSRSLGSGRGNLLACVAGLTASRCRLTFPDPGLTTFPDAAPG